MILILQKYIARSIFSATAICALVVTGIMLLVDLLGEIKNIGEGDYGLTQAVIFVLMRMPAEVYQFTPILLLLGCIVGLSILTASREVAVMRTAGFSIKQIMQSVVMAASVLLIGLCFLGEYVAPKLTYTAEVQKEYAKNSGQAVMTTAGIWFHVTNNFVHVETIIDKNLLKNVTRYEFDNQHRLQAAYFAKRLINDNNQWVMEDVVKTTFYTDRTKSEQMNKMPWHLAFNNNLLSSGSVEANEMSLPKLVKYTKFLKQNGLQANEFQYELWQRILQPLAAIIMVFLALPFVLGTFHSASLGKRLLIGIMVGFIFFIFKATLGQLSVVYQIPPFLSAAIPLVLFSFIAYMLSRKLIRL